MALDPQAVDRGPPWIPAGSDDRRSARLGRGGGGLDRDRGRATAVDHSRRDANRRRGDSDAESGRVAADHVPGLFAARLGGGNPTHSLRCGTRGALMSPAAASVWCELLWALIGTGLVVYSVTGGADLGAGFWSLCASGSRKHEQRAAVEKAIAPIWEANHVWLIFVIVLMFSGFSRAFSVLGIALHIPIGFALLGIVFRGSAYTFRAYGIQGKRASVRWERVFAWASVATPFFLGLVVSGVSSGRIR